MANIFGLDKKVVVVTGANGGVGSACARLFSIEAGAQLVLLARTDCSYLVSEINESGGSAHYFPTDISDTNSIRDSFIEIKNRFNRVDVLLNVAGLCEFYEPEDKPLDKMKVDSARWDRVLNVNGKSVLDLIQFATELMPAGSSIVNVSSTAGCYGAEMAVAEYSFAKAGIIGLTMSYAKILGSVGIRINAVAPGPIEGTAMLNQVKDISLDDMKAKNKLGILCQPVDIANIILFLASPMSRVMTGETIGASAGQFISF